MPGDPLVDDLYALASELEQLQPDTLISGEALADISALIGLAVSRALSDSGDAIAPAVARVAQSPDAASQEHRADELIIGLTLLADLLRQ